MQSRSEEVLAKQSISSRSGRSKAPKARGERAMSNEDAEDEQKDSEGDHDIDISKGFALVDVEVHEDGVGPVVVTIAEGESEREPDRVGLRIRVIDPTHKDTNLIAWSGKARRSHKPVVRRCHTWATQATTHMPKTGSSN